MTTQTANPEEPLPVPASPVPDGRLSRIGRAAGTAFGVVRKAPMTLAFVAVLLLVALIFGTIRNQTTGRLETDVATSGTALAEGRWWTVFSSAFFSVSPSALIATVLLALAVLVPAERRLGIAKTAGIFVLCQVGGVLLAAGLIELGSKTDDFWVDGLVNDGAAGASVGIVGVGLALSASLTALWRRRLRLVLLIGALLCMLYAGANQDVARFCGAVIGLVVGMLIWGRAREHRGLAASHAEKRNLVALTVAAAAVGPLIAYFTDNDYGPLATYSDLFVGDGPSAGELADICGGQLDLIGRTCLQAKSEALLAGSPAVFNLFVPAILLLIVAEGLRRGRRLAWGAALVLLAGVIVITWRYAVIATNWIQVNLPDSGPIEDSIIRYSVLLILIPLVVIAVLVVTRRQFGIRSPRWTVLRLIGVVVGAFIVVGAVYIKFGYDARDEFEPEPNFGGIVADFPKRLVPPIHLALFGNHNAQFIPVGGVAKTLYEGIGLVFWLVALGGLALAFWRSTARTQAGADTAARGLLTEYGGSTLSYMTTWPGHQYWLTDDAKAAVAYRVIGNVALTTGDPYGEPAARGEAMRRFAGYCDEQGWTPCFYSITGWGEKAAEGLGWGTVQVAEDTVLGLPDLEFKGKKWQDIRTALNKAGKAGITAQWWTFPTAPLAIQEQIRELSEEWVADKGLPEMGFTLGGLDELNDPNVRMLIAVDDGGRLHGITSWMPSYRDGEPVGWTLDFMRRGSDAFRGVMEFLIASAALGFKEEGAEFLSLSGAPLARVDQESPPEGLQRMLDVAGRALEPVYGFRSLLAFKAKFQPEYQPLYMTYPDPAALPAIGNAIGRAYLPHTTPGQMLRLSRRLMG